MEIKTLEMPASVRDGFAAYVKPLVSDPRYDPYGPDNFPQIRYALERKMWQLLKDAPVTERAQADAIMEVIRTTRDGTGLPGFLLKKFPLDENLPNTPIQKNDHGTNGKGPISELATLAIMSLIDQTPFSVPGFYKGALIQQVSPRMGQEQNGASGMGSEVTFAAHTDTSFIENPPNYFALICLRNEEKAKTNLAFSKDILDHFTTEELKLMQQPIFTFNSGQAMDKGKAMEITAPILTHDAKGDPRLRFNTAESRTTASTEAGNELIKKLESVCDFSNNPDLDKGVALESGDALFFDNGRCVHARTAFKPHEDPVKRRWLQRVLTSPGSRDQPFPGGL